MDFTAFNLFFLRFEMNIIMAPITIHQNMTVIVNVITTVRFNTTQ